MNGNGVNACPESSVDGIADTYIRAPGGTPTCWTLMPKQNTTVAATDERQVFSATVQLIGDGVSPIDERIVHFLVPPGE